LFFGVEKKCVFVIVEFFGYLLLVKLCVGITTSGESDDDNEKIAS